MSAQDPKGKTPRLIIEFHDWSGLVEFANDLNTLLGEDIGIRETDGLDERQTLDMVVKSLAEVTAHPGQVLPLPEDGSLNPVQQRVFDAMTEEGDHDRLHPGRA